MRPSLTVSLALAFALSAALMARAQDSAQSAFRRFAIGHSMSVEIPGRPEPAPDVWYLPGIIASPGDGLTYRCSLGSLDLTLVVVLLPNGRDIPMPDVCKGLLAVKAADLKSDHQAMEFSPVSTGGSAGEGRASLRATDGAKTIVIEAHGWYRDHDAVMIMGSYPSDDTTAERSLARVFASAHGEDPVKLKALRAPGVPGGEPPAPEREPKIPRLVPMDPSSSPSHQK